MDLGGNERVRAASAATSVNHPSYQSHAPPQGLYAFWPWSFGGHGPPGPTSAAELENIYRFSYGPSPFMDSSVAAGPTCARTEAACVGAGVNAGIGGVMSSSGDARLGLLDSGVGMSATPTPSPASALACMSGARIGGGASGATARSPAMALSVDSGSGRLRETPSADSSRQPPRRPGAPDTGSSPLTSPTGSTGTTPGLSGLRAAACGVAGGLLGAQMPPHHLSAAAAAAAAATTSASAVTASSAASSAASSVSAASSLGHPAAPGLVSSGEVLRSPATPSAVSMAAAAAASMSEFSLTIGQPAKGYKCKICHEICFSRHDLTKHNTIHKCDPRPYRCEHCGRQFSTSAYLAQHRRIHTGIKPYRCRFCDRKFTQLSHVQQHERIHTGEKPYKCWTCNKAFTQMSNLQSHQRQHMKDKPYRCDHCFMCFDNKEELETHVQAKHSGTKYSKVLVCPICSKSYNSETYLNKHLQKHKEAAAVAAASANGLTAAVAAVAESVAGNRLQMSAVNSGPPPAHQTPGNAVMAAGGIHAAGNLKFDSQRLAAEFAAAAVGGSDASPSSASAAASGVCVGGVGGVGGGPPQLRAAPLLGGSAGVDANGSAVAAASVAGGMVPGGGVCVGGGHGLSSGGASMHPGHDPRLDMGHMATKMSPTSAMKFPGLSISSAGGASGAMPAPDPFCMQYAAAVGGGSSSQRAAVAGLYSAFMEQHVASNGRAEGPPQYDGLLPNPFHPFPFSPRF